MMNKKQLDKWLREWQKRLRLQDWRIRLTIGPPTGDGACARIKWRRFDKCAELQVVRFNDADEAAKQDPVEMAIIHELLHLHMATFEPVKPSKEAYDAEEAAIDSIAWALYRTKYPKYKHEYYADL